MNSEIECIEEVKRSILQFNDQMDKYKGARFDMLNSIHVDFFRNITAAIHEYNNQKSEEQS
jgi:hypothetical protein